MAADTLRLFAIGARMNLIQVMRSRLSAGLDTAGDFIWHAGSMLVPILLALRFGGIGPWPAEAIVFMLAYHNVVQSVLDAMGDNYWWFGHRIGRGHLDHYLLQPQPLWRILATEGFSPLGFWPVLTLGVGLIAWATYMLAVAVTPTWIALLLLNLVASMTVQSAFLYAWGCIAFWAPRSGENLYGIAFGLLGETNFPLDPAPRALRTLLVTLVPSGLLAWFPSRALLHIAGSSALDVWVTPLAAVALSAVVLTLFVFGMRRYRQTGSWRYSDSGFRR